MLEESGVDEPQLQEILREVDTGWEMYKQAKEGLVRAKSAARGAASEVALAKVRRLGEELSLPDSIVWRMPFPGPGLAIRIIGEVTKERLEILGKISKQNARFKKIRAQKEETSPVPQPGVPAATPLGSPGSPETASSSPERQSS
jgi:hypothetical protein